MSNNSVSVYFISPDRNDCVKQFTNEQICNAFGVPLPIQADPDDNDLTEMVFQNDWFEGDFGNQKSMFFHFIASANNILPQKTFRSMNEAKTFINGLEEATSFFADDGEFACDYYRCYVFDNKDAKKNSKNWKKWSAFVQAGFNYCDQQFPVTTP